MSTNVPRPGSDPREDRSRLPNSDTPVAPDESTLAWAGVDDTADTDPSLNEPPLGELGDYELLEVIGRGGMGVVYRARQRSADRDVALKVIRPERLDDLDPEARREAIDRFRIEARAAARLDHPGIATVFDVGEVEGRPYYSMRFVEGTSLSEVSSGHPIAGRLAAEYARQVAEALSQAHRYGILHRDLKPQNVLLDRRSDRTLITDFGLAKLVQGDDAVTVTGQVFGSPPFMSPEQARDAGNVTVAADIYGLGATLYALLTGRPPFRGGSIPETLRQVIESAPTPPRQIAPAIDRDLETICLKCLEKEPGNRYATAAEVGEELRRYLAGEPIAARPVGWLERLARWSRRNPAIAGLSTVAVLLLVAVAVVASVGYVRVTDALAEESKTRKALEQKQSDLVVAERTANERRLDAIEARNEARIDAERRRESLYLAEIKQAHQALLDGDVLLVRTLLAGHVPAPDQRDLRGFEWYHLWYESHRSGTVVEDGLPRVAAIAVSPDGTRCAAAIGQEIVVWEAGSGERVRNLKGHRRAVTSIAFDAGSGLLVSTAGQFKLSGEALVWDPATGEILSRYESPRPLMSAEFLPGEDVVLAEADLGESANRPGARFLLAQSGGAVKLWTHGTGDIVEWTADSSGGMLSVDCSDDGLWVAVGDSLGAVHLFRTETGERVHHLVGLPGYIWDLDFSPDGTTLAIGAGTFGDSGEVRVYDVERGQQLQSLRDHAGAVFAVAYSPDGGLLATAGWDRIVRLWRGDGARDPDRSATRRPDLVAEINGHTNAIADLVFSADGRRLLTGTRRVRSELPDTLQWWDVEREREIAGEVFTASHVARPGELGRTSFDGRVVLSGDSTRMAAFTRDRRMATITDVSTNRILHTIKSDEEVTSLAFSHDGRLLLLGGEGRSEVWDTEYGRMRYALDIGPLDFGLFLESTLVTRSFPSEDEPVVYYWDSASGQPLDRVPEDVAAWRFTGGRGSPQAAYGRDSVNTYLFDTTILGPRTRLPSGHRVLRERPPAGERLESAAAIVGDGGVRWLDSTRNTATSVQWAVSHDGRTLVWGPYQQRPTRIIDLPSGDVLAELDTYPTGLAFSPDDRLLATAEGDDVVRLRDARSGREIATLSGHGDVVWNVAFSPDGRRIVTASWDGTIKLWDPADQRLIVTLPTPMGQLWSTWFSDDGRQLFASGQGVFVWRTDGWASDPADEGLAAPSEVPSVYGLPKSTPSEAERSIVERLRPFARPRYSEADVALILSGDQVDDAVVEALLQLDLPGLRALCTPNDSGAFLDHPAHAGDYGVGLTLENTAVGDEGLEHLASWDRLVDFSLFGGKKFTGRGVAKLAGLPRIEKLEVAYVPDEVWTTNAIAEILQNPGLHEVRLSGSLDDATLAAWADLDLSPMLELDVSHQGPASDDAVRALLRIAQLKTLRLPHCGNITSASLGDCSAATGLETLWCEWPEGAAVDASPLKGLGSAPKLRELTLRGPLREDVFAAVAHCKSLTNLTIASPHLELEGVERLASLPNVGGITLMAPITDDEAEALAPLARTKRLRHLMLDRSRLSKASFEALVRLKPIGSLVVNSPLVDADDVERLQKMLGECRVSRWDVQNEWFRDAPWAEVGRIVAEAGGLDAARETMAAEIEAAMAADPPAHRALAESYLRLALLEGEFAFDLPATERSLREAADHYTKCILETDAISADADRLAASHHNLRTCLTARRAGAADSFLSEAEAYIAALEVEGREEPSTTALQEHVARTRREFDAFLRFRGTFDPMPDYLGSRRSRAIPPRDDSTRIAAARTIVHLDRLIPAAVDDGERATALNELAWRLATTEVEQLRHPTEAVEYGRTAVELKPNEGSYWNTLGVAQYRAGDWTDAIESLEQSVNLRSGGSPYDWLFLAMAHHQLGERSTAEEWFQKSRDNLRMRELLSDSLGNLEREAARLLGIDDADEAESQTDRSSD